MRTLLSMIMIVMIVMSVNVSANSECPELFDYQARRLHSTESVDLCKLTQGKPVLVVNTASHCGFTGQFKGLETLNQGYADTDLVVLGFPSHSFRQEDSSEEKTASVCYQNYGVTFMMLSPTDVIGAQSNQTFRYLSKQGYQPKWNFNKFLIDREGQVVEAFSSQVKPMSSEIMSKINALLN